MYLGVAIWWASLSGGPLSSGPLYLVVRRLRPVEWLTRRGYFIQVKVFQPFCLQG